MGTRNLRNQIPSQNNREQFRVEQVIMMIASWLLIVMMTMRKMKVMRREDITREWCLTTFLGLKVVKMNLLKLKVVQMKKRMRAGKMIRKRKKKKMIRVRKKRGNGKNLGRKQQKNHLHLRKQKMTNNFTKICLFYVSLLTD